MVQAADVIDDAEATRDLASELAARLFPKPTADEHLLENFMFDGSDDVWDVKSTPAKEGTLRAATEARAGYCKQVRLIFRQQDTVPSTPRHVQKITKHVLLCCCGRCVYHQSLCTASQ